MDESSASGSLLAADEVSYNENGAYDGTEKHGIHAPSKAVGGVGSSGKAPVRVAKRYNQEHHSWIALCTSYPS